MTRYVDLSHTIEDGLVTYPGLPAVRISDHLSRDQSRSHYAPGVEFHIGKIEMVANTGTYLDVPLHRYADGFGLDELDLATVVDVPGVCVAATDQEIDADVFEGIATEGRAVLLATGWSRHWRTERYPAAAHPFLTQSAAQVLADGDVRLVGIDSVNIDDTRGGERPAHSTLLAAGVPIVEHLTGLEQLIETEFTFTAVPVKVRGMGTWPVRAFATVA